MSNPVREVVTLQLGHYSNFVGTHWWNLQDASLSYDPETPPGDIESDVVFREGQTQGGHVTHTPRLIAMDLKGSLRTLRQEGSLYDTEEETPAVTWDGSLMRHEESPPVKNTFLKDLDKLERGEILTEADFYSNTQPQCSAAAVSVDTVNSQLARRQRGYRLEGSVKVWSDFLRIHLHPRTISVIHQYNHDGEAHRLEAFGQGEALLQGSVLEDLEDRLHFFVEECDYLQGFQVFCDLADGFAGLGSKVTEMLQDSYGGRGILTFGLAPVSHPDSTPMKDLYHQLNCTLGTVHLASNSSFFCPLTLRGGLGRRPSSPTMFPHLTYDPSLWYHSSSVLALALDAFTSPYRLRNNSVPMWQVADALAVSGRKVVAAYGAVPFPMMHGSSLPDALSACEDGLPWKPLSACSEPADGRCYGQWAMLKGFEGQKLISSLAPGVKPPTPLHSLHSGEDVLASYISSFYPTCPLTLQLVSTPSKLTPPFPQIFSQAVGAQGFLQSQPPLTGSPAPLVSSVPVMTSLQSGPALGPWLSELHRGASALDIRRVAPSFLSQGPELADYKEALEQLCLLSRCYRDDSGGVVRSSSEEDDD
ncbi:protein misato homolog 1 isoform X1 [Larimichthys crocea]|uniref:protein misato homolog 1 isoform X1 n=1 Tax=Larimichthys crocea TaxID=215358 RepID=UPI000900EFE7|nr:protein misato homolog 1 isoform X1 [Larimichthys crocea]